jgi:hypothetical protein
MTMRSPILLSLFMALRLGVAAPVEDLASPEQAVRDRAAAEIRETYREIPANRWAWIAEEVKPGMTKEQIRALFLSHGVEYVPQVGVGAGGLHVDAVRLDDAWVFRGSFQNEAEALLSGEVTRSLKTLIVDPPKDYSGVWTLYFTNGQRSSVANYRDGHFFGEVIFFHPDGQRAHIQRFDADGLTGDSIGYYPSGQIRYVGHHRAGKQVGTWMWYKTDGSLERSEEFSGS